MRDVLANTHANKLLNLIIFVFNDIVISVSRCVVKPLKSIVFDFSGFFYAFRYS